MKALQDQLVWKAVAEHARLFKQEAPGRRSDEEEMSISRALVGLGGLAGCAGVALAASAAHAGGAFTQTISTMLLVHAPLFVAVGLLRGELTSSLLRYAAVLLLAGLTLFSVDLYVRDLGWARLFPFAAPVGGSAMIIGWLGIALSALITKR